MLVDFFCINNISNTFPNSAPMNSYDQQLGSATFGLNNKFVHPQTAPVNPLKLEHQNMFNNDPITNNFNQNQNNSVENVFHNANPLVSIHSLNNNNNNSNNSMNTTNGSNNTSLSQYNNNDFNDQPFNFLWWYPESKFCELHKDLALV